MVIRKLRRVFMENKLDKSWHLAKDDDSINITEFEFHLWRMFYSFLRWQEDCQQYIGNEPLTGYELALLHIVRMKERPKTIYEISRLLNRDDPNNIQYSLGKLIKMGLVEKVKTDSTKKTLSYQITNDGITNTDSFQEARQHLLINLFKDSDGVMEKIGMVTKQISRIKPIYDEASRLAASYRKDDDHN